MKRNGDIASLFQKHIAKTSCASTIYIIIYTSIEPNCLYTELLVEFLLCTDFLVVPNTELYVEILTWHTLSVNPRPATALKAILF